MQFTPKLHYTQTRVHKCSKRQYDYKPSVHAIIVCVVSQCVGFDAKWMYISFSHCYDTYLTMAHKSNRNMAIESGREKNREMQAMIIMFRNWNLSIFLSLGYHEEKLTKSKQIMSFVCLQIRFQYNSNGADNHTNKTATTTATTTEILFAQVVLIIFEIYTRKREWEKIERNKVTKWIR